MTRMANTVFGVATSVTVATVPTTCARPPSGASTMMVMGWPGMTWYGRKCGIITGYERREAGGAVAEGMTALDLAEDLGMLQPDDIQWLLSEHLD